MKHIILFATISLLLSGCQVFVDFDRDLLDGGMDGSSSGRVSARVFDTDAGVPDTQDAGE